MSRIPHLEWSSTQSSILTADNSALSHWKRVPFTKEELPHHHLASGTSRGAFESFAEEQPRGHPVVGAWSRTLFTGAYSHTTDADETCFNLQALGWFIDFRLPLSKPAFRANSLSELSPEELRAYARQHIFGGYTRVELNTGSLPVATRHHVIDWNYLRDSRPIPNKWRIRMQRNNNVWREVAFAKDEEGEPYYWEKWERMLGDGGGGEYAAFRRRGDFDGIIVCVGGYFNYLFPRRGGALSDMEGSPVSVVDKLVEAGDLEGARAVLSIRGGHGVIVDGNWVVKRSISPWEEGRTFLSSNDVALEASGARECKIKGEVWDIVEESRPGYVESLFGGAVKGRHWQQSNL